MSNGVLANKQPINLPQSSDSNFLNNTPNRGVIFDQQATSNNSNFKKDLAGQVSQELQQQYQEDSNYKQSISSSVDSEGNCVIKRFSEPQETGANCMVLKCGVDSVIISPRSTNSSSVARTCDCQSQHRHLQRCLDNSGGSSSDTSGHSAEVIRNKYQTNTATDQFHQDRHRSGSTDLIAHSRTSLKRSREEVEQSTVPVVAVETGLQLAKLLANNTPPSAHISHENYQKLNSENQRNCEEQEEIDEEADFDYDKVLSNVLNEKKLVRIPANLHVISLI